MNSSNFTKLLFQDNSNRRCFDCDSDQVTAVSLRNAIFLCKDCSNSHQVYGALVSKVIPLEELAEGHLTKLKVGGNKRLATLMEVNQVPVQIPRVDLYFSKLLDYYRRVLQWESKEEKSIGESPVEENLLEPYDQPAYDSAKSACEKLGLDQNHKEAKKDKWQELGSSIDKYFTSAVEKGKEYAYKIKESQDVQNFTKNSSYAFGQVATKGKEVFSNVKDYSSKKGEIYKNEGFGNAVKSTGSDIKDCAVTGFNYIKGYFKGDKNEQAQDKETQKEGDGGKTQAGNVEDINDIRDENKAKPNETGNEKLD